METAIKRRLLSQIEISLGLYRKKRPFSFEYMYKLLLKTFQACDPEFTEEAFAENINNRVDTLSYLPLYIRETVDAPHEMVLGFMSPKTYKLLKAYYEELLSECKNDVE